MTSRQPEAWLAEIFCSIQGEGPLVGLRQVFVRLAGCHRRCRFCDTPAALLQHPAQCNIQADAGADLKETNPVTVRRLSNILKAYRKDKAHPHSLSFTGGEPLLQAGFLYSALPRLRREGWRIQLETSGDRWRELGRMLPHLDYIAMDIKLPSVTGQPGTWQAHQKFLALAVKSRAATFVKMVVSSTTNEAELRRAIRLVAALAPQTPVILQPATPHAGVRAPSPGQLWRWQGSALAAGLHDVRILPQVHVLMGQR